MGNCWCIDDDDEMKKVKRASQSTRGSYDDEGSINSPLLHQNEDFEANVRGRRSLSGITLEIVDLDLDEQSFTVRNLGKLPVNLEGWSVMDFSCYHQVEESEIFSVNNLKDKKAFIFPDLLLSPLSSAKVFSGCHIDKTPLGEVEREEGMVPHFTQVDPSSSSTNTAFYWTPATVWHDMGDTALLLNPAGIVIHQREEEG